MLRTLISAVFLICLSYQSIAQDVDPSRLEDLKARQAEAQNLESEIEAKRSAVSQEISRLAKDIKNISSKLTELETEQVSLKHQLENLETKSTETSKAISNRRTEITELLAALQRIESNPPPALATHPNDAAKAFRAGLLLQNMTAQLSDRVASLNVDLQNFDSLQAEIRLKQSELDRNQSAMTKRRTILENRVGEKNALESSLNKDFSETRKRRLALAEEAQSLQDLIDRLERKSRDIVPRIKPDPEEAAAEETLENDRPAPPSNPVMFTAGDLRFSSSKGKLYPVTHGRLSKRYSIAHPGISIVTSDSAQVFAPASGRVEFAGPFKNYDEVIILNVGDGYYVLLTGLNRLLVQDNSKVSAGDPVGLMPVNSPNDKNLYIELRKNGSTIDPVPWFGTTFAKPNNG